MPASHHGAASASASGVVPVPTPERRVIHGESLNNDYFTDNDAPDIDLLSRSLPTSGPVLEPEPADLAMLRPVTSNQSHIPIHDDEQAVIHEAAPSERSPLLRPRTSSAALSSTSLLSDSDPILFLNGTSPSRFWYIFSQILAVQFIGCFDGTIMASSHPVITSYFGAANSASWLSTAFLLTSTAFQPLLGRLSDAVGRKPLFLGSLVVFGLATLWCALADSIEGFIAARAFCGLGAGGSMTLGSIITSDLVPIEYVTLASVGSCANFVDDEARTSRI